MIFIELKIVEGKNRLILEEKKADGSAGHIYSDLINVLKIDSDSPNKVVIDLKAAGERLDVDRYYTVKLQDDAVKDISGNLLKLSDISWTFDTLWGDRNRPDSLGTAFGGKFDWDELGKINSFKGLLAGQVFQVKYISPKTFDFEQNHYPLNFEAYPQSIGYIDRNGILTISDDVQGTVFVNITAEAMSGNLLLEIPVKNNLNRKMQVLNAGYLGDDSGSGFYMSEGGNSFIKISTSVSREIRSYNSDLLLNEAFYPYTFKKASDGVYREEFRGIVKVEGKEYLKITAEDYATLLDEKTGEIFKENIPPIDVQLDTDSSIFSVIDGQYTRLYDVVKNQYVGTRYKYEGHKNSYSSESAAGKLFVLGGGLLSVIGRDYTLEKNISLSDMGIDYTINKFMPSKDGKYVYFMNSETGKLVKTDLDGNKLWENIGYPSILRDIAEFENGYICIGVRENKNNVNAGTTLHILNPETGETIKSVPAYRNVKTQSHLKELEYIGEHDSCIYINGMVLDADFNTIAYTDVTEAGRTINSTGYDKILQGGYVYRLSWEYGDGTKDLRLERLVLTDSYIPEASEIQSADEIIVRENTDIILNASVLDQHGFIMQEKISLSSDSDNILTVAENILKIGFLKDENMDAEKTVIVTVSIPDTTIKKDVRVIIRKAPVPVSINIIEEHKGNKLENNALVDELDITTRTGGSFNVFVEDQYGDFLTMQPIEYIVDDTNIVGTRLYQGSSGNNSIKYQALVDGSRAGETTITARLAGNHNIYDSIRVIVSEVNYEILWEIGTDGPWGSKKAYHIDGIYNDFIYTNENNLAALNRDNGKLLWKTELGSFLFTGREYPKSDQCHGKRLTVLYVSHIFDQKFRV